MMEMSRRARRMQRHHKKNKQPALNLVSLMDIFTILVFFLLVNSSSSQQLPKKDELTLPTSISESVPEERLTITVTRDQVLVGDRAVGKVVSLMQGAEEFIAEIKNELDFYAGNQPVTAPEEGRPEGRAVSIVADENTPYELISKILSTCQHANYTNISFAATQTTRSKSE